MATVKMTRKEIVAKIDKLWSAHESAVSLRLEKRDQEALRKLSRQALKGVDRKKQRNVMQMIDGSEFVTITRVFFGWDVADRRGSTFVSVLDFPRLQGKGLDEFVDGRSVAGLIVDRAKCAVA